MGYTKKQLEELIGTAGYQLYRKLNDDILDRYQVSQMWDKGGKDWESCLRYSRGGKTLCTVYFREGQAGVLIIFGKKERERFEESADRFSAAVREKYYASRTYHDGKWMLFDLETPDMLMDMVMLLAVKKAPDKKLAMCGYCCDMCKVFARNVKKKDQRASLSAYWERYYGLLIPAEKMQCDGCRCKKSGARRIDDSCPVRACVMGKKLEGCWACTSYPCEVFRSRKGLSPGEADAVSELDIAEYYEYLGAFDNKSRLDRREKYNHDI